MRERGTIEIGKIMGTGQEVRSVLLDDGLYYRVSDDDHPQFGIGDWVTVEFDPKGQYAVIVDETEPTKTIVCNKRSYDVPIDVYNAFEKMRCQLTVVANHLACVNDVESRELLESVKWALK
jgi:hypothetical protein